MSDTSPLRAATPDDYPAVARLLFTVFLQAYDDEESERERELYEPDRGLLVESGGRVVAHTGAYTRDLTVPGAVLPAAYVTQVGVLPTHRRQGLLTRMMERQLRDIRGTEAVAVLWATEGRIYQRFGYGMAATGYRLEINTREVGLPPADESDRSLRMVDLATSGPDFAAVYDRLRPGRPGWASRDDRWWRYILSDPPSSRHGSTEKHAVVLDGPDGLRGYAIWRIHERGQSGGPSGEVDVREVVAADPGGYRALWRFLLSIDLTRSVRFGFCAPDEPLLHLVGEPRQLNAGLADTLWVRLVDVPAALAARRYATPVDVVLEVTDPLLPENTGRFRLTGDADKSACELTDAPADLACGVLELGAAYLGGTALSALAAAGRIRELTPGALAAASPAFGWHRAPVGIEVF